MSNVIAKANVHPISETQAIMSVIERVAMSPDADINKLEKMLDMQERVLDRNARMDFDAALAKRSDDGRSDGTSQTGSSGH